MQRPILDSFLNIYCKTPILNSTQIRWEVLDITHAQWQAGGQVKPTHYEFILYTMCCANIPQIQLMLTSICPPQIPHGMSGCRIVVDMTKGPAVSCVPCNVLDYNEEIIQSSGSRNSLPPSLVYKWWPSASWWTVIIRNVKDVRLPACAGQDMHQGFQKGARMSHAATDYLWYPWARNINKRAWPGLILLFLLLFI
jgi:hypothetical protein